MAALLLLGWTTSASADFFCRARWGGGDLGSATQTGTTAASIPVTGFGDGTDVVGLTSATAHVDHLSMGTAATFHIESQFPLLIQGANATAIAEGVDVVTPHGLAAGASGFLVYDLTVSGSNASVLAPTHSGDVITHGGPSVSTQLVTFTCAEFDVVPPDGSVPGCSGGTPALPPLQLNQISYVNLPVQLSIPIHYEVPIGIYFILTSTAGLGFDPAVAETFDAATSFSDTITVVSVELQDADGNAVPGASLSASSGTAYPVGGGATTTTTLGSTTTTTLSELDPCVALAGIPHARCRLEAAIAAGPCTDPIPPTVMRALSGKLNAADTALGRALDAAAAKQTRLVHAARGRLAAAVTRATKAVTAKRPAKRITPACATGVAALVTQIDADF